MMPFNDTLERVNSVCFVSDLSFQEISYTRDYAMPIHAHEEAHLVFGLQGTMDGGWRKQTLSIDALTLTFMPMHEPHTTRFHQGVTVFLIKLLPSWLERIGQYSSLVDGPAIYRGELPIGLAMRLYREFQNRDNLTPLMLEGLTLELMAQMTRLSKGRCEERCPRWLIQTKDFLHAHFTETLSLETVAAAVGVHSSHLTRTFRKHYQCSLGDYIRRLRVEYACSQLSTTEAPLGQIALDAGFADQGHFSRTFKSLTGVTPAQFRRYPDVQF